MSEEYSPPTSPLPPPIAVAMEQLIEYRWAEEADDFFTNGREEGPPTAEEVAASWHIFVPIVRLDQWLCGKDWSDEGVTLLLQAIYQETQEQDQIRRGETEAESEEE